MPLPWVLQAMYFKNIFILDKKIKIKWTYLVNIILVNKEDFDHTVCLLNVS